MPLNLRRNSNTVNNKQTTSTYNQPVLKANPSINMKLSITLIAFLAAFVVASPAAVSNPLQERIDCSKCGCSSAESCTVGSSLPSAYHFHEQSNAN